MGTGTGEAGFLLFFFSPRLGERRRSVRRAHVCSMPFLGWSWALKYMISFNPY